MATLGEIDPPKVMDIDRAIREAVKDCYERSGLPKARKVTVTIELIPEEYHGDVHLTCEIGHSATHPASPGRVVTGRIQDPARGLALFNGASPDAPDQMTLDDSTK
jgi:hypothetical protein